MDTKKCCKCLRVKPISEFNKQTSRKGGLQSMCRGCSQKKQKEYYRNNKEKFYGYNRKRLLEARKWFEDYKKGLKCVECGESHPACLDFHHDSGNKEGDISNIMHRRSISKLKEEIAKCKVLCSNCHRKLHYNEALSSS